VTLAQAIQKLRALGHIVEPSDWGLVLVNGRELTQGQVVDLARRIG
jgi:hypothetical protein